MVKKTARAFRNPITSIEVSFADHLIYPKYQFGEKKAKPREELQKPLEMILVSNGASSKATRLNNNGSVEEPKQNSTGERLSEWPGFPS
jgi:hypothetical protein